MVSKGYLPQSPKILDFIDYFKAAIVIYLGKDINYTNYCSKLKSGMNSRGASPRNLLRRFWGLRPARTDFSFYSVYPIRITLNWLIGFIEGDGSFCFSQLQPRLSIGLHIKNMRLIQSIKEFIDNLPIMYDVLGKVKGPNGIIHKRMAESETKMVSIYWSGIDRLYYYIIPN